MTKSTITRDELNEVIATYGKHHIAHRMANVLLAAMDREPVVPDEMTPEQAYEIGDYHGDPVDVFARGANWMRQHIIDSTLSAAPQSPGSEPTTVPGKWIPVSERMPLTPSADCEYSDIEVNVFDGERVFTAHYATGSQPQPWGYWVDTYAKITHWQPLPAAPPEVK